MKFTIYKIIETKSGFTGYKETCGFVGFGLGCYATKFHNISGSLISNSLTKTN